MSRVLFLDIDGVVLPGRAHTLPNQTSNPFVTVFDPCAVSMLNRALAKQDRKIVLHSSWIRSKFIENFVNGDVIAHCVGQGIAAEHFHPDDPYCNRDMSYRYDRIDEWLARHPECSDFVVLDDVAPASDWQYVKHFILTDFDEGITVRIFRQILDGMRPR